ncbi:hypothetical protein ACQP2F_12025 [Actinoplanes sp. CA-030573]|uniref:hypothetical protein n=1 Tax=Actinoplanes sp. CA-030573 TaxID=3239898 RepID=UPI003D8C0355
MPESKGDASSRRLRWGWLLVGMVGFVIVAALIGYQIIRPFSDWVNDVLGRLGIGE